MALRAPLEVAWERGLALRGPRGTLRVDAARPGPGPAVVTHAHLDHLRGNAHMTAPTRDFLAARLGALEATTLPLGEPSDVGGWEVTLHDAGHCLGAAMVEVEGVLYTGDFNPAPALTTPAAQPAPCEALVVESTYGDPRFRLPPRELVLASLEAWLDATLPEAGVALGAYPLGRAQELVALLNRRGHVPAVPPEVLALCGVYAKHGVPLRVRAASPQELYGTLEPGQTIVVPRALLARGAPFARHLGDAGARAAYVSGWCAVHSFFEKYAIDAQFALTDHASLDQALAFVRACEPRRVYTVLGQTRALARAVEERLGIPAVALA